MNIVTERILGQGQALVHAIEALETIEPSGPVEWLLLWFDCSRTQIR